MSVNLWKESPWGKGLFEEYPGSPISLRVFIQGLKPPMVTLIVGPEEQRLAAHEQHLCEIEYFKKALTTGFKESKDKIIRLPDESPQAVKAFLAWLLLNTDAWIKQVWLTEDRDSIRGHIVDAIMLADKWQVMEFANCGYRLLWDHGLEQASGPTFVQEMVAAWEALKEIKARFLPIHLILLVIRAQNNVDLANTVILAIETQNSGFWADLCRYEKVLDLVLDGDSVLTYEACLRSRTLIDDVVKYGKTHCEDVFSLSRFQKMDQQDVEKLDRWIEGMFARS